MTRTVRITSDGTPWGTAVLVDGVTLPGVVSVTWSASANTSDPLARAVVTLVNVEIDALGDETE